MPTILDRPLLSDVYETGTFQPESGSVYLYGTSVEERSHEQLWWLQPNADVTVGHIVDQQPTSFVTDVNGVLLTTSLRSASQLAELLNSLSGAALYLDITGLGHHVWAPILRVAMAQDRVVRAVYVEPDQYRRASRQREGEIYDLSEGIAGIQPIPGFASLVEEEEEDSIFVPLLGFEGARFAYVRENVQPEEGKTIPIVGVPGFRPEYPFSTYYGNQIPLVETRSWLDVRYAIANCPFSLYYALEDIARDYAGNRLQIAPIGTKPHALGAVLFVLFGSSRAELVYDHPVRSAGRTIGSDHLLVYHVSSLREA